MHVVEAQERVTRPAAAPPATPEHDPTSRGRAGAARVLIVPFADGIGDFVMMLPLLTAVQRRFPAAKITVAASQRSAQLLEEGQGGSLCVRTPSWFEQGPAQPRGEGIGRMLPQSFLAWLAGASLQWQFGGFDRTFNMNYWWERGYDFQRYWTPQVPPRPGAVHTLDFLADRLGQALGQNIPIGERCPRLNVRAGAARAVAARWASGDLGTRPVVALIPASNMNLKRWPARRWAQLSDHLSASGRSPLLILPPGSDQAEAIPGLARRPLPTLRAPLDEVAAVLARCQLAVGVDTGLLHLAAAVGTRYVGLFGPTNPAVTGPYDRALGTAVVAPFIKMDTCRGCWRNFKYIDDRCATLPVGSCMNVLGVPAVRDACEVELAHVSWPAPESLDVPLPAHLRGESLGTDAATYR